jgi:hypothetical protein
MMVCLGSQLVTKLTEAQQNFQGSLSSTARSFQMLINEIINQ